MISSLFTAFDRYPSSKGAATHIEQSIEVLFDQWPTGMLCALGDHKLPNQENHRGGSIERFSDQIPNFIDRVEAWGEYLQNTINEHPSLELIHFRDPWSGIPLLEANPKNAKWVYEVNGLPSIELPYHFPTLPDEFLDLLRKKEDQCLLRACLLYTSPSPRDQRGSRMPSSA